MAAAAGSEHAEDGYHPQIRKIFLNAVDVRNQQTQPEEEFYVEITAPNLTFQLGAPEHPVCGGVRQ